MEQHNDNTRFFSRMKSERLSEAERSRVRLALEKMLHAPVPTFKEFRFPIAQWFFAHRPFAYVLATLCLMAFGGVSYSAESALPGGMLYPLKVTVNEPLRGAFAFSSEAKVRVEAELAERRLAEVSALIDTDSLQPEVEEKLINNAAIHAEKFVDKLTELENKIDPRYAANISSKLEFTIGSHARAKASKTTPRSVASSATPEGSVSLMAVSESPLGVPSVALDSQDAAATSAPTSTAEDVKESKKSLRFSSEERLDESARRLSEIRERMEERAKKKREMFEKKIEKSRGDSQRSKREEGER